MNAQKEEYRFINFVPSFKEEPLPSSDE